jgi:hypothetical protein
MSKFEDFIMAHPGHTFESAFEEFTAAQFEDDSWSMALKMEQEK